MPDYPVPWWLWAIVIVAVVALAGLVWLVAHVTGRSPE